MSYWIKKIPIDWEIETLDKCVSSIVDNRGRTAPTAESGIPLIATNCIKEFGLHPVFEKVRYIDQETYKNWFRGHPEPNDILFVNKGTPGGVCLVPDPVPFCIAQDMVALRADPKKFDWKYLFAALRSGFVRSQIEALNVGTSIPHLKKTDFNRIVIPKPKYKDQVAIGEIYFSLSQKIELNLQMNKTLEEMAMALYKHWFMDFGPFQDGEFVDSELGEIPKGWEVRSIYDLANYINGAAFKSSDFEDSGLCVIKIAELRNGITSNTKKSNKKIKKDLVLKDGAVLFSWSATLDIFLWDKGKALLNQHIFNVIPNGTLPLETLYFVLKNIIKQFQAIAADRATTMGHIKISHLKETFIAIPGEETRKDFDEAFQSIYSQILNNLMENQTLTQFRDTILSKLISGEIRVKEVEKTLSEVI